MENTLYFLEPITRAGFDFQMEPPDADNDGRFYLEANVFQSGVVNFRNTQFTQAAIESLVQGFKDGVSLMVNHVKWEENVGYGSTIDAKVDDDMLVVMAYLLRGYVGPNGTSADMLIKAVEDGFLKDVSASVVVLESRMSIDDKPYEESQFYRGQRVVMEDGSIETAIQIIDKAEPVELSLVFDGATREGEVIAAGIEFSRGTSIDVEKYKQLQKRGTEMSKENEKPTVETLQAKVDELTEQIEAYKRTEGTEADLIAEGRAAREAAIDHAIDLYSAGKEGCTEEDQTRKRADLESKPMDDVHEFIADWEPIVKRLFPAGRQTVDHGKGGSDDDKGNGNEEGKAKPKKRQYIPKNRY